MAISGRALLSAMGMNAGRLQDNGERLYFDLAFLAGLCGGNLPQVDISAELDKARTPEERGAALDKQKPLSDMFWELDAFADSGQTGKKLDWGGMGRAYRNCDWTNSYSNIGFNVPYVTIREYPFLRGPDPEATKQLIEEQADGVRSRLRPVLARFGLSWPKVERESSGTHRYRG